MVNKKPANEKEERLQQGADQRKKENRREAKKWSGIWQ